MRKQRKFFVEISAAACLLLAMSIFACWNILKINTSNLDQRISNVIQNKVDDICEDVQFADASQLKYLATAKEVYKSNYLEAKERTQNDLEELFEAATQSRSGTKDRLTDLQRAVERFYKNNDEVVEKKRFGVKYSLDRIPHESNAELIRRIFQIADIISHKESTSFSLHEMSISNSSNLSIVGILLGSVLSFAFLFYSFFSMRKEVQNRIAIGEDLLVAQQSADRASRMRNQFYAVISHELRTPLNGILGISEVLREKLNTEEQVKYIKIIQESGNSLLKMVNDLLNISKIESGKLELEIKEFALPEIVRQVETLVALRAQEKGLIFKTSVDPRLSKRYFGDAERIKQIMINLLVNSVKYTKEGSVSLRVKLKQERGGQSILRFEIEDTGVGIKDSDRQRIFSPFQQVKGTEDHIEGFGLGLSIVKSLVELMRGAIDFTSTVNHGSMFWFEIPLRFAGEWQSPTPEGQKLLNKGIRFVEEHQVLTPLKPVRKILVVEDNPTNQILIETFLNKLGHDFILAENGKECLDKFAKEEIDLILMDCSMPIMDGYEATKEIRRIESLSYEQVAIPIVALTAHAMEEEREKCLSVGMNDYLSKPFTFKDFKEKVQKYIQSHVESEVPSMDWAVYQNLVMETGEDMGKALLESFHKTLTQALNDLNVAIKKSDQEKIKYWCHLLRSSASTLGFRNMAGLAERIELDIKAGKYNLPDVDQLIVEIQLSLSVMWDERADDSLRQLRSRS